MNGGRERRAGVCRIPRANQTPLDCRRFSPGGGDVWPESGTVFAFCSDDGVSVSPVHRSSVLKFLKNGLQVLLLPSAFV